MARTPQEIVAEIRAFRPADGYWRPLDDLLTELWATGEPTKYIPDLLAVFERFPEEDGAGVMWSILHGLESMPCYEAQLIRSLRRQPSEFGVRMVGRLLNAGVSEVDGESFLEVLRSVAEAPSAPENIRIEASRWMARHGSGRPT